MKVALSSGCVLCAIGILLQGCSDADMRSTVVSMQQALSDTGTAQAGEELQPYNQGSAISSTTANYLLTEVARPQSFATMRKLLGTPARISEGREVFPIAGSSDGVDAGRRLVVLYQPDARTNYTTSAAYDWYIQ